MDFVNFSLGLVSGFISAASTNLIINPVVKLKSVISDIDSTLIEYANIYTNPQTSEEPRGLEASQKMRRLASILPSSVHFIPFYSVTRKVFKLPKKENINAVKEMLIKLSNYRAISKLKQNEIVEITKTPEKIRMLLGLPYNQKILQAKD